MSFKISTVIDYNRFIAIDIGASKIKALICAIENGELTILGSSLYRQSKKNSVDGEISDLYGVSESIKKAIAKAGESLDTIPKDVVISLSSSYMLYDTINTNYVREDKTLPITMEEIDSIIKKVEYKSLERVKAKSESRIGIPDSEMRLITTSITSIVVDGKKITNPIGFTGKNIKLGLINVFIPFSHSSVLQNIGRGLGKNIISLIPSIITLPKIIEESDENFDANCFLDFGHSKTTIVLQNNAEILGGNVLNFWFSLLEDEFRKRNPHLGHLDIENIVAHPENEAHREVFDMFYSLLFDAILIAMNDITKQPYLKNVFVSGGGASAFLEEQLQKFLETKNIGDGINITSQYSKKESSEELNKPIYTNVVSLAKTTQEMLLLKKDPIARILRYIIYRYE